MEWTEVDRLANDEPGWKILVGERIKNLDLYERQQGHKYEWATGEQSVTRNVTLPNSSELSEFLCRYEGCDKVCLSKCGLTFHRVGCTKPPGKNSNVKKNVPRSFFQKKTWKNHMESCTVVPAKQELG